MLKHFLRDVAYTLAVLEVVALIGLGVLSCCVEDTGYDEPLL